MRAEIDGQEVCAGKPCPHSTAGGCGIYATRPRDPCRNFVCSWLVPKSPLPEWMRPDRCGAIVLLSMPWHGQRVIHATPVGPFIPVPTLEWLKDFAQRNNRALVFYERITDDKGYTGLRRFGFGPPGFRDLVASVAATELEAGLDIRIT